MTSRLQQLRLIFSGSTALVTTQALLWSTTLAAAQSGLPTGGQVASGSAQISSANGQSMTVTQMSPKAIVNWGAFSIGEGKSVTFQQPNAGAAILNRVTGEAPTSIGALSRATARSIS